MKHTVLATISAIAVFAAAAPAAHAACPAGEQAYYTSNGATPPVVTEHCTLVSDNDDHAATTGDWESHLTPVLVDHDADPLTPDQQLVIDGKPIVTADASANNNGNHDHPDARVIGTHGVAVGNGSLVGRPFVNDNGTPDDTTDDFDDIAFVNNGTAVGANSNAAHNHSTAVGADTRTSDDHQIALGTGGDTIRARGITSDKSKNRQQGPVELVTSDSGGRLATDGGATFAAIEDNTAGINANTALLSRHVTEIEKNRQGVSIAMAMPDSYLNQAENFALAAGFGGFDSETAFGMIGTMRFSHSVSGYVGGAVSTNGGEFGWKAGARVAF